MSKVSDDAGIYSMFRLKLHEGGGFPIAGVFEHCYLVKPWHLSKFGASYEGIRRLPYRNKITVALEEIWLNNGAWIVNHQHLNDSIYQFYNKKLGI